MKEPLKSKPQPQNKKPKPQLAAALRANLKRRKLANDKKGGGS